MAWALVQHVVGNGAAGVNIGCAATGGGHVLVVAITNDNTSGTVTSVSDGTNNFVQVASARFIVTGGGFVDVWWLASCAAGSTNIAVTGTGLGSVDGFLWELSGAVSPQVDSHAGLSDDAVTGTTYNGASLTTVSPQFVIGAIFNVTPSQNPTTGNEFTSGGGVGSNTASGAVSLITTTAGAHQPSWTSATANATVATVTVAFGEPGSSSLGVDDSDWSPTIVPPVSPIVTVWG